MSEPGFQSLPEGIAKAFERQGIDPNHPVNKAIGKGQCSPESAARNEKWLNGLREEEQKRIEAARHIPEDQVENYLNTDNFHSLESALLQLKHQGWAGIDGTGRTYSPDDLLRIVDRIPDLAKENEQRAYTDEQLSLLLASMGVTRAMGFRSSVQRCIQRYFMYATRR